jgi:biotin-dependent carboxylase-like uncharacterized protein
VTAAPACSLVVVQPGALTTVQDAGRPGLAHLGVAPSGFLDVPAARLANRLVGNDENDALLETTVLGPALRLQCPADSEAAVLIAVTGAPVPIHIDGRRVDQYAAVLLRSGETLTLGTVTAGVRSYLAVRGGLRLDPVLGSRSGDLLSGLGSPALAVGYQLPVGTPTHPVPPADFVAVASPETEAQVGIFLGPADTWFEPASVRLLTSTAWSVSPTSSRVGLRLTGPRLLRLNASELPPEGMVRGAIQVPPDGQPVVLLADGPVTGGYPVVGVVQESDHALLAQAAPGTQLRFRLLKYPS